MGVCLRLVERILARVRGGRGSGGRTAGALERVETLMELGERHMHCGEEVEDGVELLVVGEQVGAEVVVELALQSLDGLSVRGGSLQLLLAGLLLWRRSRDRSGLGEAPGKVVMRLLPVHRLNAAKAVCVHGPWWS